jgi:hypothetical protein
MTEEKWTAEYVPAGKCEQCVNGTHTMCLGFSALYQYHLCDCTCVHSKELRRIAIAAVEEYLRTQGR